MLQNNYSFEGLEPDPTLTDPRRFGIPEGAGEPISTITGKPSLTDFGEPKEKGLYNLEGLESDMPTWGEVLKKAPASGLASVNVGLARLVRDTIKIADMPASAVRKAFGIKGERPDVKFLEDYMTGEQKRQEVLDVSEKLSQLPHWHPKRIIGTGLQAVPQVAAVAGGALMGAPFIGGAESAATMLGAIAYGPSAEEAKSEGANEIQQILHGITSAQIEVLTELPVFRAVGQIWKHLKRAGVAKKAGVSFAKRLLTGLGLYGKGLALETTQEIEAYLGGQVSKKLHYDPNATINFKNAVEAGYGGLSMAATVGIAGIPGMAVKLAGKGKVRTTPEPTAEKPGIVNMIDEGMTTGEINGEPFTPEIATGIIQEAYADKALTSEDLDAFREKYPNLRPVVNDVIGENVKNQINTEMEATEKIKIEAEEAYRKTSEYRQKLIEAKMPTPTEPTAEVAREPVGVEKKVEVPEVEAKEPWRMTKAEIAAMPDKIGVSKYDMQQRKQRAIEDHYYAVKKALKEGKKVPKKVLIEYPDLKPLPPKPPKAKPPEAVTEEIKGEVTPEPTLKVEKIELKELQAIKTKKEGAKIVRSDTYETQEEFLTRIIKEKDLEVDNTHDIRPEDLTLQEYADSVNKNELETWVDGLGMEDSPPKFSSPADLKITYEHPEATREEIEKIKRGRVKPKVEKEKVEVTPEIKKPWEITRDEYVKQYIEEQRAADFPEHMITDKYKESIMRDHFAVVSKAFAEDKTIPPEVLKDYPDLKIEEKVEAGIIPEGKEISKLDLTKQYVKETGEKIEKGELGKVKEKYPEEWAVADKAEKDKKNLWDKLPEEFRYNRGINEYTTKELKDMVVWENLTLDEFEKVPLKERGKYTQLPKSVREERLETERWAEEQERKKKEVKAKKAEEKAKLEAPIEAKTGIAWIKNVQKPILSTRKITRGKNKGKYEIVLTKGRDAEGNVKPGLKRIVAKDAIVKMPIEKQFATKATKPQDTITRADLKSIFAKMKNISTGVDKAGNFFFRPLGKPVVTIYEVNEIEGYIDTSKGQIPVGSFLGNTIELKTGGEGHTADIGTAWHEFTHWMEANGILSNNDIKALDIALEKQGITPNTETRAEYVGDRLSEWQGQKNLRIRRVLKKIADFVNSIWEMVTRTRTARGVLADIETGAILSEKELSAVNQFAQDVSFSLKKAAKAVTDNPNFVKWFGNSKVIDEKGEPLVVYHGTNRIFTKFDPKKIGETFRTDEKGFFFLTRKSIAKSYADSDSIGMPQKGGRIIEAYVSLQKPLIIDEKFLRKEGMSPIGIDEDVISFWDVYQGLILEWADKAKSDGIILVDSENGDKMVVAFEPTQIKSIYNTGAFGITEPDIMFATKPTKDYRAMLRRYQEAHTTPLVDKVVDKTKIKHFYNLEKVISQPAWIKDKFGRVEKTLKEKIGDNVGAFRKNWQTRLLDRLHPIKALGETAYMLHRLETGAQATMAMFMRHGKLKWEGKALTIDTQKQGFMPWLDSLGGDAQKLFYWMAAKRAEVLETEGREKWLDADTRKKIFKWVGEKPESAKNWKILNNQFQDFNKSVLNLAQQSGLINPVKRATWEQEFYVPFYRIFEDVAAREEFLKGPLMGKKHISAQIKRLLGAEMKIGDPLENVIRNWSHLIHESVRNMARAEAYDYAQKNKIKSGMIGEGGKLMPLIETVKASELNIYRSDKEKRMVYVTKKGDDNILSFQKNGRRVYFKVNDVEMFNALSDVNHRQFNGFLIRACGQTKRWLTYGATFGPAFKVANMLRDSLHTAIISKSFIPFVDSGKGIVKALREDADYVKFMASGAGFGSSYIRAENPQALAEYINRIVKKEGKGAVQRIFDTPKKMLDFWEKLGAASENAARVQLYTKRITEGETHLKAAFEGRDLMDFTMKGDSQVVQFLIRTIPFMNARAQGLYKLGRAAKQDPKSFMIKGSMLTMATLALWAINKDEDEWKELEDWDKRTYYHFWIGNKHYRIPKPFETGAIFSTVFEGMAEVMSGDEEFSYFVDVMKDTFLDTFAMNPIPQAIRPLIEQWSNKSFFTGRPIEGQSLQRLRPGERKTAWTSETMQLAGKLGVSPKRAEEIIRGYFSTFGMFLLGISDIFSYHLADFPVNPTKEIDDYPLLGRFIKEKTPARHTKYQTEFYEIFREVDQLVATVNNYKKLGNYKEAVALSKKERKNIIKRKGLFTVRKQLTEINAKLRKIMSSRILTAEQKRAQADRLIERKNRLTKRAYEIYVKD